MFQQRRVAIDLIQWKYQGSPLSGRKFGKLRMYMKLVSVERC